MFTDALLYLAGRLQCLINHWYLLNVAYNSVHVLCLKKNNSLTCCCRLTYRPINSKNTIAIQYAQDAALAIVLWRVSYAYSHRHPLR